MNTVILSSAYFPPVQYFTKLVCYENIQIDLFEHYIKQSYRNRALISGANALLTLSVPIAKGKASKYCTKDMRISYDTNWQVQHWRSIVSAYKASPFFDYYADDLKPIFEKKHIFLVDLNEAAMNFVLENLQLNIQIKFPDSYVKDTLDCDDWRVGINPKKRLQKTDKKFMPIRYLQVFIERHSFLPNLSILDLLFNEGSNTISVIKQSCIST